MDDDFVQYCGRTDSMGIECEKPELKRRIAELEAQLAEAQKAAEIVKLALWNVVEAYEDVFCSPGANDHIKKCVKHEIELATAMLTPISEHTLGEKG